MSTVTAPAGMLQGAAAQVRERAPLRIDLLLLAATVGLAICSLVVLDGATHHVYRSQPHYYTFRQAAAVLVGLVLMLVVSRVDLGRLRELKWVLYGTMIVMIVGVLGLGGVTRGSKRWIALPFFNFQPSELGKLLLVLTIAAFLVGRTRSLQDRDTTVRVMLLALFPAMLVMAQPDLGSGMVYIVIALACLFIAGAPWRHFAALFALIAVSVTLVLVIAPAAGVHVLSSYQEQRLTGFVSPSHDPANKTYQITQSEIAIGSGQRTGRGTAQATETQLSFLPASSTDFVFAVIGETYGFLGAAIVLLLYALVVWRGLRILTMAKTLFGALVAGGIVAMLLFQVVVNVGMTIGIMPITGVPLPLMSYGPASVLVTFLALGLLQSIYVRASTTSGIRGRAYPL